MRSGPFRGRCRRAPRPVDGWRMTQAGGAGSDHRRGLRPCGPRCPRRWGRGPGCSAAPRQAETAQPGSPFAPPATMATSWAAGIIVSEVDASYAAMGECQSAVTSGHEPQTRPATTLPGSSSSLRARPGAPVSPWRPLPPPGRTASPRCHPTVPGSGFAGSCRRLPDRDRPGTGSSVSRAGTPSR